MSQLVYKVLTQSEYQLFTIEKVFAGSPIDLKDGFIHLANDSQVDGVIARYFSDVRPVYVLAVPVDSLGSDLRWEVSTRGEAFPHLYDRELDWSDVQNHRIVREDDP